MINMKIKMKQVISVYIWFDYTSTFRAYTPKFYLSRIHKIDSIQKKELSFHSWEHTWLTKLVNNTKKTLSKSIETTMKARCSFTRLSCEEARRPTKLWKALHLQICIVEKHTRQLSLAGRKAPRRDDTTRLADSTDRVVRSQSCTGTHQWTTWGLNKTSWLGVVPATTSSWSFTWVFLYKTTVSGLGEADCSWRVFCSPAISWLIPFPLPRLVWMLSQLLAISYDAAKQ